MVFAVPCRGFFEEWSGMGCAHTPQTQCGFPPEVGRRWTVQLRVRAELGNLTSAWVLTPAFVPEANSECCPSPGVFLGVSGGFGLSGFLGGAVITQRSPPGFGSALLSQVSPEKPPGVLEPSRSHSILFYFRVFLEPSRSHSILFHFRVFHVFISPLSSAHPDSGVCGSLSQNPL